MPLPEVPYWLSGVLAVFWCSLSLGLALYGFHAWWLVLRAWQCRRHPSVPAGQGVRMPWTWPAVTVQIPLYNEMYVAERVIDACARLDYPADRLEIQVLDDSRDGTCQLARARVAYWQRRGVDIRYMARTCRTGFKAGALRAGLDRARGEYLAIFDADFQPPADFLRALLPHLLDPANRHLGFVQARWQICNAEASCFTRALSLAVDGHFAVEACARSQSGLWFGFNGSAGLWRRSCIQDPRVGGWSGATLCEDLHLSYLAQLAGWRGLYLDHVTVPADVPVQLSALRLQQFRWAKGSIQTLRLLARPILQAGTHTRGVRFQGLYHLGTYLMHPCLLGVMLLSLPMSLLQVPLPDWLLWLVPAALGPAMMAGYGQWHAGHRRWWRRLSALVPLLLLGVGLCYSNTVAIGEAARGKPSPFERTPKGAGPGHRARAYARDTQPLEHRMWPVEAFLTLYCLIAVSAAIYTHSHWLWPVPLLGLCSFGLLAVWTQWHRYMDTRSRRAVPAGVSQAGPGHAQL